MRLVERGELDSTSPCGRISRPAARRRGRRGARDHAAPAHAHGRLGRRLLRRPRRAATTRSSEWSPRLADLPQLTPLGEVWSYNNAGFYIAGRVIEVDRRRSRTSKWCRSWSSSRSGSSDTFFFAEDVMTRRFAVGHHRSDDGPPTVARRGRSGARITRPAGSRRRCATCCATRASNVARATGSCRARRSTRCRPASSRSGSIFEHVGLTWALVGGDGRRVAATAAARTGRSRSSPSRPRTTARSRS